MYIDVIFIGTAVAVQNTTTAHPESMQQKKERRIPWKLKIRQK